MDHLVAADRSTGGRGFDPVEDARVPLAGHLPSCRVEPCSRRGMEPSTRAGAGVTADHDAGRHGLDPPEKSCEQAYVPAEQPPPPQGARFPPADAYPRGPLDPFGPAPQGPQQARRLTLAVTRRVDIVLPAAARLTSGESFRRCVRSGHRAGSRTVVLHLLEAPAAGPGPATAGFVVSRAVGGAVVRNRVR